MLGMSRKVLTLRREQTNLVGRLEVWQALILWLVVNWPRKSLSPCSRYRAGCSTLALGSVGGVRRLAALGLKGSFSEGCAASTAGGAEEMRMWVQGLTNFFS